MESGAPSSIFGLSGVREVVSIRVCPRIYGGEVFPLTPWRGLTKFDLEVRVRSSNLPEGNHACGILIVMLALRHNYVRLLITKYIRQEDLKTLYMVAC